MNERPGLVTMRGNPVVLLGNEIKVGDKAPDFVVVANDLKPVSLSDYGGKICIISSVPSLDTPICEASTKRFNEEAARLGPDVAILTISMDLPFAQKRWCAAEGIDRVQLVSDYQDRSFGKNYGLLIDELKLLARAVYVVDANDNVVYREIVPEVTSHPNYDAALDAARSAAS